jgi:predicted nucleotidyltransferase
LLSALSDRPELDTLERFLARLLETRADDLEFVVLFGSMARGNWSQGSDYDVLVGLRVEDGKRLIDRIGDLESLVDGNVQVFPYDRPAWERMFESFHPLLLEALDHGVLLFDRGRFAAMREVFSGWRAAGVVTPLDSGWRLEAARGE